MTFPPTPQIYTPLNWYWVNLDGRIYSSASNSLIYPYDPGFVAFVNKYVKATPWPIDAAGKQTTAAMQAVMAQYNVVLPFT